MSNDGGNEKIRENVNYFYGRWAISNELTPWSWNRAPKFPGLRVSFAPGMELAAFLGNMEERE